MSLLTREWGRAMTHDEMKYPDGSKFRPERFLKDDGQLNNDNKTLTYGFGRRCVQSCSNFKIANLTNCEPPGCALGNT